MNIDQLVELAELQNKRQIEQIKKIFPELTIEEKWEDNDKKFHYYFRCLTSEDDTDGFDTPVQALAHFAKRLSDEQDAMMVDDNDSNIEVDFKGYQESVDSNYGV